MQTTAEPIEKPIPEPVLRAAQNLNRKDLTKRQLRFAGRKLSEFRDPEDCRGGRKAIKSRCPNCAEMLPARELREHIRNTRNVCPPRAERPKTARCRHCRLRYLPGPELREHQASCPKKPASKAAAG